MSSRFVLTTNQVVEIMLKWLGCRDWKEAFLKVIPQRKQPKAREGGSVEEDGDDDGEVGGEEEEGEEEREKGAVNDGAEGECSRNITIRETETETAKQDDGIEVR